MHKPQIMLALRRKTDTSSKQTDMQTEGTALIEGVGNLHSTDVHSNNEK
jgi:hypothetical protein